MEELIDQTKTTIQGFSKSVSKMNLYIDRLILEAEKGCVMSSQLRPSDEKLVIETTQQAIRVILKYDELLETIKEVEMKKKSIPDIDYTDYKLKTIKTLENLKTDVVKLKLFKEYSDKTIESLANSVEEDSADHSSFENSYSFS